MQRYVKYSDFVVMPNHAHSIAVPGTWDGLSLAISEAHRRYTTRLIHFRKGWRGHLWQGRFSSSAIRVR